MLGAAVVGRTALARRHRRRTLLALAGRYGLGYSAHDRIGLLDRYYPLEMLRRGHHRQTRDLLYGNSPAGAVSVFRCCFEEGFGVRRRLRPWWLAVVETQTPQEAWQAVTEPDSTRPAADAQKANALRISAAHESAVPTVRQALTQLAGETSGPIHFEARGRFVAVALPDDRSSRAPEQAFHLVRGLASCLAGAAARPLPSES